MTRLTLWSLAAGGLVVVVPLGLLGLALGSHEGFGKTLGEIGALSAFLVFALTQIFTTGWKIRDERLQIKRVREGLLDEIQRNLDGEKKNPLTLEIIEDLKNEIRTKDGFRPLLVLHLQVNFYEGIVRDLPILTTDEVNAVNDFYFQVSQARAVSEGIERETFFRISENGRCTLLDKFWSAYEEALAAGERAKRRLGGTPR